MDIFEIQWWLGVVFVKLTSWWQSQQVFSIYRGFAQNVSNYFALFQCICLAEKFNQVSPD